MYSNRSVLSFFLFLNSNITIDRVTFFLLGRCCLFVCLEARFSDESHTFLLPDYSYIAYKVLKMLKQQPANVK